MCMNRIPAVILALIGVVTPPISAAGTTTEERFVYYAVSGDSAGALRASINRERSARGKRFDALTTWHIRWQFSFVPRQKKCKITEVSIDASIEYLLPYWPDAGQHPDSALVSRWQQYFNALYHHELHHGQLVKTATLEIEKAIHRADDTAHAPSNCGALEKLANQRAREVMWQLDENQVLFDVDTDHGRKTGATFP